MSHVSTPSRPAEHRCDVLVIGGGPAGSTAAALLAEKGHQVTLLEKARHPRFHIGESLLPANLPLFDKLGVRAEVEAIGMQKWGAEFVSPWHEHRQNFEFADAWDKSMPCAYQVRRSEFDEILIRNATRKGADVIEGCRVREVEFLPDDGGALVRAHHDDGRSETWRCRFLVDASGRDTFLGNRFQAKQRNPKHNSAALYGHFKGAQRHPGKMEGHISIFWFEQGWFWFIPLADGTTSVGAVTWPRFLKTRKKPVQEFFLDLIAQCPALAARLENAELVSEVEATGNFSYSCDRSHGANYLLLGDAYAFIDPVFSSGVMLAMNSAFAGADAVDVCLRQPGRAAVALKRFDQMMKHGPREFSWFIYRVTNPTMRDLFMSPRNVFRVKEALLSVLAGDIFGKTPIWRSLWMFKTIYYLTSLANLKRTILAWKRRKLDIRYLEDPDEVACR
ncbi:MAG: NAD(P)/FAD-dependent oxidoreductase [Thiobacillus sp.]|uniref:NAD(P)/FAD-dependent oxidoreductase n=1 Tax=Thiobacillus sp. TaxID=924 RepID=UPI0027337C52|nr:NAD(P)/FAD-dependent oxidoreductase [Thiobacillus sp.]MDP3585914.1 NAD(P)/FAD-dependent oxidoreductase [Thiobacillus sp.]